MSDKTGSPPDGRDEPMPDRLAPAGPPEPGAMPQTTQPPDTASPTPAPAESLVPGPVGPGASTSADEPSREPDLPPRRPGILAERPEAVLEVPRSRLVSRSRRDFLLFGAGLAATVAGGWWLLPDATKRRLLPGSADAIDALAARIGLSREHRERVLNRGLDFDDDVAEALYSKDRRVRTYRRSDVTPLRNNYHGRTPGPEALEGWALTLAGLASEPSGALGMGRTMRLTLPELSRLPRREQVTRLVCVEGWSAIAWWGGVRFADLIAAYPPAPGAKWVALRSSISLDEEGRIEPYYVSIDLPTAMHPQTLLATEFGGRPLPLAHGAPLRLIAPMKLGLKNIKAITDIAYVETEPADYWNERGYSSYDGL